MRRVLIAVVALTAVVTAPVEASPPPGIDAAAW
jgi:hypothetical protein